MLRPHFAMYFGEERKEGFIGAIAEHQFFGVLSTEDSITNEDGHTFLKNLALKCQAREFPTLAQFDEFVADEFRLANIPLHAAFACIYTGGGKLYLKTRNEGELYARRGGKTALIINGDTSAAGILGDGDFFVCTTKTFSHLLGGEHKFPKHLNAGNPADIKEALTPKLKEHDDNGAVALFVEFIAEEEDREDGAQIEVQEEVSKTQTSFEADAHRSTLGRKPSLWETVKAQYAQYGKRKVLTFAAVAVIFFIFLWSVVFGYMRRSSVRLDGIVASYEKAIIKELTEAEDVAFLNLERARSHIEAASAELASLEKEVGDKRDREIVRLKKLIADKEAELFATEKREGEEFFDLTLESQNAKGTKMTLSGDVVAILDPGGATYVLSLSQRSLDVRKSGDFKNARIIGLNEDTVYFVTPGGVFSRVAGKTTKVIDADSDWDEIVDMAFFNKNIYLLDRAGDIHKHVPAEQGYSKKSSYLAAGQSANFTGANSIAIDGAVYVGLANRIDKFLNGFEEKFTVNFPDREAAVDKVLTNEELEKVYAWDRGRGVLYVIGKSGEYERQIASEKFGTGDDVIVYKNDAYILDGSKIFIVPLE